MQPWPLTNSRPFHHSQGGDAVPAEKSLLIPPSFQPLATMSLLSISMILPILFIQINRINKIIQYVTFCVLLLLHNVLRCMHFGAYEYLISVCTWVMLWCMTTLVSSSVRLWWDVWVAYTFRPLYLVLLDTFVDLWLSVFNSLLCTSGSGINGSCNNFNFLRNHQTVFFDDCTILYSHQERTKIPITLYLCWHSLFSFFGL